MARPLSTSDPYARGGYNGAYQPRYSLDDVPAEGGGAPGELEQLRSENAQLHALRAELEQALIEATQQAPSDAAYEERMREYELLLEEKTETIRSLAEQLEEARAANDRHAEQAQLAQAAMLARAEIAERGREEVTRELTTARAEAEALQAREQAAQEAADALRGELAGIKGRGGWRGVLLRLAGAGAERRSG